MILVLSYHELAMVAGTTTSALVLGIGAFVIFVLPWFRAKSQDNEENAEGEQIEMTVDPRSHIEEISNSSSTGFGGIFLRASDCVRAAIIPKSFAVTPDEWAAMENRGNSQRIEMLGKSFRDQDSTIERPILMAQRFNQFQSDTESSKGYVEPDFCESFELVEMLSSETRTIETPGSVATGSEKYSRDSLTVPRREPVAYSTWKNIGPLFGSSIYRQGVQRDYEDPRRTKESSVILGDARGSRIDEIPLDLSVQSASRVDAKSSSSDDIAGEKKSARAGMREENSRFLDENGNDGGSGLKKKVFRGMLAFLRLKKASGKRHKASERSDSIKFSQVLSSSCPSNVESKNIPRANKSTGSHDISELKNSEIDRGVSRKFKKIIDPQNHSNGTIKRLDGKQKNMQIVAEPIPNTRCEEISLFNNNCGATKPTKIEKISSYLKIDQNTFINKDCIEPCTEL